MSSTKTFTNVFRKVWIVCVALVIVSFAYSSFLLRWEFSKQGLTIHWTSDQPDEHFLHMTIPMLSEAVSSSDENVGIYFLETARLKSLTPRQLCTVESAALHNRARPIFLGISSEDQKTLFEENGLVKVLSTYPNIRLVRIDTEVLAKGTPLEEFLEGWEKGLLLKTSKYKVAHESDALRPIVLYKFGGIYLDLDMIVKRSFDGLNNAVGLQDNTPRAVNNAFMAFEKGHPMLLRYMDQMTAKFDGSLWSSIGPNLISRLINKLCGRQEKAHFLKPSESCEGIEVLPTSAFNPVPYSDWKPLFERNEIIAEKVLEMTKDSWLVHYWNSITAKEPIKMAPPLSALAKLAMEHCPVVSKSYDELWGLDVHHIFDRN